MALAIRVRLVKPRNAAEQAQLDRIKALLREADRRKAEAEKAAREPELPFDGEQPKPGRPIEAAPVADGMAGGRWIRLPGVSRTGPCEVCAQYFGMIHDKSGVEVPLIQLHDNCVCRDVPVALAEAVGGVQTFERFKWLQDGPGRAMQTQILGRSRASMLRAQAAEVADFYKRPDTPLSSFKPLVQTALDIARASTKADLIASAVRAGASIEAARKMTRGDLLRVIGAGVAALDDLE